MQHYCGASHERSSLHTSVKSDKPQIRSLTLSSERLPQYVLNSNDLEQHVLAVFRDDYCIVPGDVALSRGYLRGLGSLLASAAPSSDVARAVKIVALASLGNKLDEPGLIHRAYASYPDLLRSFQVTMSKATTSDTIETLATAVLLGLFEVCSAVSFPLIVITSESVEYLVQVIRANEVYPGEHSAHVRGVAAILTNEDTCSSRHPAAQYFQIAESSPLTKSPGGPLMVHS